MHKQPMITASTKKKIMNCFWEEYKLKPIEKITIISITKSAGIHRSTFYEYFKDIYDLLEQFETNFLEHLKNEFIPLVQSNLSKITNSDDAGLENFINTTMSFFAEYGDYLYYLTGSLGDPSFRKKLYCLFKSSFLALHNITTDSPYADYLASLVFSIILNNLEYWYEHKNTLTLEKIIVLTYNLIGNNLINHNFFESLTGQA